MAQAGQAPGFAASKPRIEVGADRTAVIAWRGAAVDSEGDGIQAGPPAAIMRSAGGAFTFQFRLSTVPVTEIAQLARELPARPSGAQPARRANPPAVHRVPRRTRP
jgi:hypothetical protein